MSEDKKKIPSWAAMGHKKPVSRRDFLMAGIIPFAASVVVPNWISLLLPSAANAQAAGCPVPQSLIPFVTLNLSGGASLSSNFLPMDQNRQPLPSYKKLGLGNSSIAIDREFGGVPFAGDGLSTLLAGLRETAGAGALANTAFVAIPCDSFADSNVNKFDITGLVTKAGLIGTNLPVLLQGNRRLSQSPAVVAPPTPLQVRSFANLSESVGYTAALASGFTKNQQLSITKLLSSLTASQTRKLANVKNGADIQKVIECAGIKNVDIVNGGAAAIDPRQNTVFSQVWGINAGTALTNSSMIQSSIIYNTLLGTAGAACLEMGGYDYHDNTRTSGNNQDRNAGRVMGRILASADALKKPVMLYVTTDGGNSCPDSENRQVEWTGDRSASGIAYLLYYNPNGRPATSDYQIGHYNAQQAADTKFLTGGNAEVAACAVFANYCKANNRMDTFETLASRIIDKSNLKKVLVL